MRTSKAAVAEQPLSALLLRFRFSTGQLFDVAGATAQGVVLKLVEAGDPAVAAQLQGHHPARPYTIAVLPEERSPTQIAIRVTAVGDAIPQALKRGVERLSSLPDLHIGPCWVREVSLIQSGQTTPWVAATSLSDLDRDATSLGDTITLVLATPLLPRRRPVSWRDGPPAGASLSPALLFDAMRERWRVFGPGQWAGEREAVEAAALQAEVISAQLTVASHLRRAGAPAERELLRGVVGRITLLLRGSLEQRVSLRRFAAACFYLGAGVGTAHGMGCIRAFSAEGLLSPSSLHRPGVAQASL
jgi:hypothetical protein